MRPFYQSVAVTLLLLIIGVSGSDCLVQGAQMSQAEKACCRKMAGQCDMNMPAHPCCKKVVQRHNDADLKDLSALSAPSPSWQVATLESNLFLAGSVDSFALLPEERGLPPHGSSGPSVEILRI
jgi:hypothetical protein